MEQTLVTIASASEQLAGWLRGLFKGHLYGSPDGKKREVRVFEQAHPPLKATDPDAEVELETVPYAISHIVDGQLPEESNGRQTVNVIILLSTYRELDAQEDPAAGQKELWGMIDKVQTAATRYPHVGSFDILRPIDWTTDDGANAPFYFGALSFKISVRAAFTEESDYA